QGFCATLDFGLHGNVHVWVGNNQGMASVPWAANDPIFWMHHCNIDRLWASWNKGNCKNPAYAA
ncbi:MAG TPA: tyrosinase family protein, partial [Alphaproteobacteria bacterium]|nr:tyrosinase family protein [Alphaproteobacteria bacterium]